MTNNMWYILITVYILSLLLWRWMVKKDIKEGYAVWLEFALVITFFPVANTTCCVLWLFSEMIKKFSLTNIAKKFFK